MNASLINDRLSLSLFSLTSLIYRSLSQQKGAKGFLKGVATGVTGLILRPVVGVVDTVNDISEAVRNTASDDNEEEVVTVTTTTITDKDGNTLSSSTSTTTATFSANDNKNKHKDKDTTTTTVNKDNTTTTVTTTNHIRRRAMCRSRPPRYFDETGLLTLYDRRRSLGQLILYSINEGAFYGYVQSWRA